MENNKDNRVFLSRAYGLIVWFAWKFYVLKSTERDAKFTRSGFKNKLPVLYFIHYNSLLISVLEIYYQCLTSFYKATGQEKWISAMKELETPHTCKPSTNGGSYFIEVQLL